MNKIERKEFNDLMRRVKQTEHRLAELESITPEFPQFGSAEKMENYFDNVASEIFHGIQYTINQAIDDESYSQKFRDQMYTKILNRVRDIIDSSTRS